MSSTTRDNDNNKRRRVSRDNDDVVPPAVVSSSGDSSPAPAAAIPMAVALLEPFVEGEIAKLVADVQKHDETIVIAAMKKLRYILTTDNPDNTKNRNHAGALGAHHSILAKLKQWQHSEQIHNQGWACLANIACTIKDARVPLLEMGVVEVAINAMKLFPNSPTLIGNVCVALHNLFLGIMDANVVASIKRFVNDYRGIELVVQAMKRLENNAHLQGAASGLFSTLSSLMDLRTGMVAAGVAAAVGVALQKHGNDEGVKKWGKLCMRKLFADN